MLDVGLEDLAGSRAFHSHRLPHPTYRHTGNKRGVLAAVPRHATVGAFAFGSPGIASCHGGVSAALVHENEATDVEPSHLLAPVHHAQSLQDTFFERQLESFEGPAHGGVRNLYTIELVKELAMLIEGEIRVELDLLG
jgi:hypothetical protein